MKVFVVNKRRITRTVNIILLLFVISVLSVNTAVNTVMANKRNDPITCVEQTDGEVAVTLNLNDECDADSIIKQSGEADITVFVSERCVSRFPEEVRKLAQHGCCIGLLEDSLKGKTRKEINDTIAMRIEELAYIIGRNPELVRFDGNSYDNNCVKAVFALGLFPVQWSCDETAGIYSGGDIIFVSDSAKLGSLLSVLEAKDLESESVSEIILRENYEIDLSGRQSKK